MTSKSVPDTTISNHSTISSPPTPGSTEHDVGFTAVTAYGAAPREAQTVSERIRVGGQAALRRYGMASSRLRRLPDYMIIGAKRGGTTSLARWLLEHPQIRSLFPALERRKGAYYFDVNYGRGEAWYRSHFPTEVAHTALERKAGKKLLIGDSTPYYLHHPHAPARARRMVPHAKIIVLLRSPVERAFGHWGERTRQGIETLTFKDALDAEAKRIAGEEEKILNDPTYTSFAHQHYSYVDQGRYSRGLSRWMEAYPSEQLLVLRSEDMYDDPATIYKQVLDFLSIEDFSPEAFSAWNMKSTTKLEPDLQAWLAEQLADDIERTEALLARSMGWI